MTSLTPQNRQAAHILTHIRGFESRPQGNQRPFPISVQPYSSSGQPKQWVQTPSTSSSGIQQSPGWYSPASQSTFQSTPPAPKSTYQLTPQGKRQGRKSTRKLNRNTRKRRNSRRRR